MPGMTSVIFLSSGTAALLYLFASLIGCFEKANVHNQFSQRLASPSVKTYLAFMGSGWLLSLVLAPQNSSIRILTLVKCSPPCYAREFAPSDLEFARDHNLQKVVIDSESCLTLQFADLDYADSHLLRHFANRIKKLVNQDWQISFSPTLREGNRGANSFARLALNSDHGFNQKMDNASKKKGLLQDFRAKNFTFSNHRIEIFKKANKLSNLCTLCGAKLVIILFSPTGKFYAFDISSTEIIIVRIVDLVLGFSIPNYIRAKHRICSPVLGIELFCEKFMFYWLAKQSKSNLTLTDSNRGRLQGFHKQYYGIVRAF
ncbi:agamous-like MADS-box protein AGL62 [Senna tora]|uniref:Agamous-like MADS-box protein AGL62 n=1 Tax=Senna tora TaxID=362788 RepID=A0A834SCH7_9FABA|nr:agamous-like MADS-box protein AGL62 [Senna tora]